MTLRDSQMALQSSARALRRLQGRRERCRMGHSLSGGEEVAPGANSSLGRLNLFKPREHMAREIR
jgi:hypothetical protein